MNIECRFYVHKNGKILFITEWQSLADATKSGMELRAKFAKQPGYEVHVQDRKISMGQMTEVE